MTVADLMSPNMVTVRACALLSLAPPVDAHAIRGAIVASLVKRGLLGVDDGGRVCRPQDLDD